MVAKHTGNVGPQQPGIYALATPPGRSAIAVVRLSGEGVRAAVEAMAGAVPPARVAQLTSLHDRPGGETIDRGVVLWFPAPHSYTGEDVAELHLHGGRATVAAAVAALDRQGLRAAEPGEFTRRAFHNGKIDLTQAEAVADLVDAETAGQRRQALRQMDGALGVRIEGWRERLLAVMAAVEAVLDFADETLPDGVETRADAQVSLLRHDISEFIGRQGPAERLREGVRVAILGPPNAGKSSLLNALACRDAAIVSSHAGTTRDVVEVHLDLGGVAAIVGDTAGLRDTADAVEAEGVRRATAWGMAADLKLLVGAADDWGAMESPAIRELADGDAIVIGNKVDLAPAPAAWAGHEVVGVSVSTGAGMDGLLRRLEDAVRRRAGEGEPGAITRARHRQGLAACVDALDRFLLEEETELRAEELRIAARALGRLTGRIDVEDVLDRLFRTFCIGK